MILQLCHAIKALRVHWLYLEVQVQVRRLKMYSKTAKRDKAGKIIHQVRLWLSVYTCSSVYW